MAKSIEMHEIEEVGHSTRNQASGSFWEHWFKGQSPLSPAGGDLDEHSLWEKAINFGILAAKKAKC
jgi:hypothetical protein